MKKWQEIEFLDFKERQIRRRTQKTRAIQLEAEINAAPASGLRFVAMAAAFVVVVGVGGFAYKAHRDELHAASLAQRAQLSVTEVKGEVEYSTATTPFGPLKDGTRLSETFTVRAPAHARCTVATALANSRLVVQEKASVEIQRPAVHDNEPVDRLYLVAAVKTGTLMCEFKKGEPRLEIKLPQNVSVFGSSGLYKVVMEENGNATVLVREGLVKIASPASKSKSVQVRVDQKCVISADGTWAAPVGFPTPETVWR